MPPIKVLYIGDLRAGQSALFRADALTSLGCLVTRWHRRHAGMRDRLRRGSLDRSDGIASKIRALREADQFDICWVDKAGDIPTTVVKQLKQHGKILVHYTGDTPMGAYKPGEWRGFRQYARYFDFHFVVKLSQLVDISSVCNGLVRYTDHGYGESILRQRPPHILPDFDLVFVGAPHGYRGSLIRRVAELAPDLRIAVFGNGWIGDLQVSLPNIAVFPSAFGLNYSAALWRGRAALALVTHWNEDDTGHRLVEIAAAGVPAIGEDCPGHRNILRAGLEMIPFRSPEEVVDAVHLLIEDPHVGSKITQAAKARIGKLDLTYTGVVKAMLKQIEDHL